MTRLGRVLIGSVVAYMLGFLVERALGGSAITKVGWTSSPWTPLAVEGFAVGLLVGGWPGVLLAPLPFLLVPETLRLFAGALTDFRSGQTFFAVAGLIYVAPLLLTSWVGGLAGALARWVVLPRWVVHRAERRPRR